MVGLVRILGSTKAHNNTRGNFQVKRRPFLTLFIQLATTIIFDLGLNKAPPITTEGGSELRFHQPWALNDRTSEERRAVVACYFLSSM